MRTGRRTLAGAGVWLLTAATGSCEQPLEPEQFATFSYERQFEVGDRAGTIESLSLERLGNNAYQLQFTRLVAPDTEPCSVSDCYVRTGSDPRSLTAGELDAVREAFAAVRWEADADAETCPLWDPAYLDVFTWDGFVLTTNLCNSPWLPYEQAEPLRQVLFGLTEST